MRKNGIILKNHSDVPLMGGNTVDYFFIKRDDAALDGIKAGYHSEQGGFTAAGRPEQGKQFAAFYIDSNMIYGIKITVRFYRIGNMNIMTQNVFLLS